VHSVQQAVTVNLAMGPQFLFYSGWQSDEPVEGCG